MATGNEIEKRGHIVGFREEISKAADCTEDTFFTWFDSAKDKDTAFIRGSWDFTYHIALPASKFLSKPEEMVAMEIGFGGGRLLASASRYFKAVVGVDIHDYNRIVEIELMKRGINNISLIKTNGENIPLENSSIDFVYSFIVLQHVEKIRIFKEYLSETNRILKTNGIAVLYFGRKSLLSSNKSSKLLYLIDRVIERFMLPKGYKELPSRVNEINLIISLSYARSLAREFGFEILSELVSHKRVPDGINLFGGQNGFILMKK